MKALLERLLDRLKWMIARRELEKLDRIQTALVEARCALVRFPDAVDVLTYVGDCGENPHNRVRLHGLRLSMCERRRRGW